MGGGGLLRLTHIRVTCCFARGDRGVTGCTYKQMYKYKNVYNIICECCETKSFLGGLLYDCREEVEE